MANETNNSITLLLVGALIGLGPTMVNNFYQTRIQRKQFVFDKQITAINAMATVTNVDGYALLDQFDRCSRIVTSVTPESSIPELERFQEEFEKFSHAYSAWAAQLNVQSEILTITISDSSLTFSDFPLKVSPSLPISNFPTKVGPTGELVLSKESSRQLRKELDDNLKSLRKVLPDCRHSIENSITSHQQLVRGIGKYVSTL